LDRLPPNLSSIIIYRIDWKSAGIISKEGCKSIEFGQAHNFYLFLYTDLGILGLITSILIPFSFYKIGNRLMIETKQNDNSIYPLVLGIQGAGIALFQEFI